MLQIERDMTADVGIARILSGVHFFPHKVDDPFLLVAFKRWATLFPQKVDDLFLVIASKRWSKTTNSSSKSS